MIRTHILRVLTSAGLLLAGCGTDAGHKAMKQGLAAFSEKHYDVAIDRLTLASKRLPGAVPIYYHLGLAHLHQGHLEPAQAAFDAALELEPGHRDATACLGQIAYLQNDLSRAVVCFEAALSGAARDEDQARILTSLGLAEMGRERYDLARLALVRAQQADQRYAPAYYNLGSLYRDHFNLRQEALDQFELYLRLAPENEPHLEKAENNVKRLRLNIARTAAEQRENVKRDPEKAARLLQEGARLHAAKQLTRAIKAFRDALVADPLTFSAAYGLGVACKALGRHAEALDAFRHAVQINPANQECYLQAAELAIRLKQHAEAARLLDRAMARSPFNPAGAEMMARLRHAENRLPEARAYGMFYLSLIKPDHKGRNAYEQWVNRLPVE